VESSLADNYRDIIGSVGFDLGWGRGPDFAEDQYDGRKLTTLKQVVKGGLQQFYNPPPDQTGVSYQWSFLKPFGHVTLASGARVVKLPEDFKGLEGLVHVAIDNGGYSLKLRHDARASYAAYPDDTGQPQRIEIEGIPNTTKERGQRFQFVVWPEADAAYTLQFHYSIQGVMLTGELPYAYGGAEHSSTIKASCLAWAELHLDDIPNGPKQQFWRERLAASISMDRQKQPKTLGYNSDRSDARDARWGDRRDRWTQWPRIEYQGQVWE
jgi:hypothetical protein